MLFQIFNAGPYKWPLYARDYITCCVQCNSQNKTKRHLLVCLVSRTLLLMDRPGKRQRITDTKPQHSSRECVDHDSKIRMQRGQCCSGALLQRGQCCSVGNAAAGAMLQRGHCCSVGIVAVVHCCCVATSLPAMLLALLTRVLGSFAGISNRGNPQAPEEIKLMTRTDAPI